MTELCRRGRALAHVRQQVRTCQPAVALIHERASLGQAIASRGVAVGAQAGASAQQQQRHLRPQRRRRRHRVPPRVAAPRQPRKADGGAPGRLPAVEFQHHRRDERRNKGRERRAVEATRGGAACGRLRVAPDWALFIQVLPEARGGSLQLPQRIQVVQAPQLVGGGPPKSVERQRLKRARLGAHGRPAGCVRVEVVDGVLRRILHGAATGASAHRAQQRGKQRRRGGGDGGGVLAGGQDCNQAHGSFLHPACYQGRSCAVGLKAPGERGQEAWRACDAAALLLLLLLI